MPGRNTNRMPSAIKIRDHWAARLSRGIYRKFPSYAFAADSYCCFACRLDGERYALQRAHIVPAWRGGPDWVGNLHLLCSVCHRESEDLWGRPYWRWFLRRRLRDVILYSRGEREFGEGVPEMTDAADAELVRKGYLPSFARYQLERELSWRRVDFERIIDRIEDGSVEGRDVVQELQKTRARIETIEAELAALA